VECETQKTIFEDIDITQGKYLIQNVERAPSMDSLVFHPPGDKTNSLFEVIQYKSCESIQKGLVPSLSSVLLTFGSDPLPSLPHEVEKVTCKNHQTFYGKHNRVFIFISNKPLASDANPANRKTSRYNYESVKANIEKLNKVSEESFMSEYYKLLSKKSETKYDLIPPDTVIICNENFRIFAGPFAHFGLFLENKHKNDKKNVNQLYEIDQQQLKISHLTKTDNVISQSQPFTHDLEIDESVKERIEIKNSNLITNKQKKVNNKMNLHDSTTFAEEKLKREFHKIESKSDDSTSSPNKKIKGIEAFEEH